MQALLDAGADVNTRADVSVIKDRFPERVGCHVTPIVIAAKRGHASLVELLIKAGADLAVRDGEGKTALDWARKQAHEEIVRLLRTTGRAEPEQTVEERLLVAAQSGKAAKVRVLLSQKPNLEARDQQQATKNLTALMVAADAGHVDVVRDLLAAGANPNARDDTGLPNREWRRSITPDLAEEMGLKLGRTALHYAAKNGHAQVVRALLDARADPNAQDRCLDTPLRMAVEGGHREVVETLIGAGADVNRRCHDDYTALLVAVSTIQVETSELLLRARADVNACSQEGSTVLQEVLHTIGDGSVRSRTRTKAQLQSDARRLIELLLQAGADPNQTDSTGNTALHNAASDGLTDIAETLLDAGANINAQNQEADTPLHQAARWGHKAMVALLLQHNAEVNLPNSARATPLKVAEKEKHAQIANILRKHGAKGALSAPPSKATSRPRSRGRMVIQPDFSKAADRAEFNEAVGRLSELCGSKPGPLQTPLGDVLGGVSFYVPSSKTVTAADLEALHDEWLKKGCYVFTRESVRKQRRVERLAVLPTTDKYKVIAAMLTNGCNYDLTTGDIIDLLKRLERKQPFILTGIGHDFLAGKFTTPIKDPQQVAKLMDQLCPGIVGDAVEGFAKRLVEKPEFFFWWD